METLEAICARLRRGIAGLGPHQVAATELLISAGWPNRRDFLDACVRENAFEVDEHQPGEPPVSLYVHWDAMRRFRGRAQRVSTSELSALDLALALADDDFGLTHLGHAHADMTVLAVARASRAPEPPGRAERAELGAALRVAADALRQRSAPRCLNCLEKEDRCEACDVDGHRATRYEELAAKYTPPPDPLAALGLTTADLAGS